jgi:hypothetical protein
MYWGIGVAATLVLSASTAFAQAQTPQNRIPQQVSINGQMVNGAYVTTASGQLQGYTCPTPQPYKTADGSSQGWACYEQTTGVWLLNAAAPPQAPVNTAPVPVAPPPPVYPQAAPPAVYPQAPPTVVYQPPVYQAPPTVVYQTPQVVYAPPPTVIYSQPATVIYQQPAPTTVVYTSPRPVIVEPVYPSSVILGKAAIDAAGRIASAAILNSHHSHPYYGRESERVRRW